MLSSFLTRVCGLTKVACVTWWFEFWKEVSNIPIAQPPEIEINPTHK